METTYQTDVSLGEEGGGGVVLGGERGRRGRVGGPGRSFKG